SKGIGRRRIHPGNGGSRQRRRRHLPGEPPELPDRQGPRDLRPDGQRRQLHALEVRLAVVPNSLEVWNPTSLLAPAEAYWECWLDRGVKMPATAGSDTHGALGQVGTPTTWVFSRSRREPDIVRAIDSGRTSLSR